MGVSPEEVLVPDCSTSSFHTVGSGTWAGLSDLKLTTSLAFQQLYLQRD